MARKITGCNWAYEVIEGLDLELRNALSNVHKKANRSSSLRARSGLKDVQIPGRTTELLRKDLEPDSFDHLAPGSMAQYDTIAQLKPDAFLKQAETMPGAPRPKIVVLDYVWNLKDPIMPDKASFLTKECEAINAVRCLSWKDHKGRELNPLLKEEPTPIFNPKTGEREWKTTKRLHHGAACVGALRISKGEPEHSKLIWGYRAEEQNHEVMLWNLSSRADIILLPLRAHAALEWSVYKNALNAALKTRLISPDLYHAFYNTGTFDLINTVSEREDTKNVTLLHQELRDEIMDGGRSRGEPLPAFEWVLAKARKKAGAEGADLLEAMKAAETDMLRALFGTVQWALEEAGLVATLDLLSRAASEKENGHAPVGRGDTLVVPLEMQLWNADASDGLVDSVHCKGAELEAKDFFKDRVHERHASDCRPDLNHITHIELPVIAYRAVEKKVETLTCTHKISVIVSAGNSHLDLGQICVEKIDSYLPTKRFGPDADEIKSKDEPNRLFETRGTNCGAVIVGSGMPSLSEHWMDPLLQRFEYDQDRSEDKKTVPRVEDHKVQLKKSLKQPDDPEDHRWDFANYGLCVNVFGRGAATEIYGIDEKSIVDQHFYYHWSGASIASMVAAACIANVQHIRLLSDYTEHVKYLRGERGKPNMLMPLKPFEARAHFQQWRANDSYRYPCLTDLMGAPPDIQGWFRGSCYFDRLQDYALKGLKVVNERYAAEC